MTDIDRFYSGTLLEPEGVLVADDGDQLHGFAELSIRAYAEGCSTDRVAYLEGWYVEPAARNRGIGRALVSAADEWARRQDCTEFASDAELENEGSARAHVACGFEEVGRLRCFRKAL